MLPIYNKARKEFEKYYDCRMNVEVFEKIKKGAITRHEKQVALENIPCRISQKAIGQVADNVQPSINYATRVYCSPDLSIPSGSELIIIDVQGVKRVYKQSSEPFFYHTHQEFNVERLDNA